MITLLIITFVVGYLAIALEHNLHINKAAPALITGVVCWTIYILMGSHPGHDADHIVHELIEAMGEHSQVLFFLLGAMTIVELIDAHGGFTVFTDNIKTDDNNKLLWMVCIMAFFLSAVLDNLATTIVMVSILRKLVKTTEQRIFFLSMVVIAANAGGAWSPIGDVTTTMLWIEDKITSGNIIVKLIIPSLVCLVAPLIVASLFYKKYLRKQDENTAGGGLKPNPLNLHHTSVEVSSSERMSVLLMGVGALVFVPIFKILTHLPPFMGMLLGVGVLWLITELMHKKKAHEDKDPLSVVGVLRKIDVPSVLFFWGILIAISALEKTGILHEFADYLHRTMDDVYIIGLVLGLFSSILDNVPLVAASIKMFDYPTNDVMWEFIAYCAGTGGSALIIGSAAGVAAMGMENINFVWYFKRITLLAVIGYFAGALAYIGMVQLFY